MKRHVCIWGGGGGGGGMFVLDGGDVCMLGGHVCMFVCGLGGGGGHVVAGHVCVWGGGGVCVHVCVYEGADDSPDNCRDSLQYTYVLVIFGVRGACRKMYCTSDSPLCKSPHLVLLCCHFV